MRVEHLGRQPLVDPSAWIAPNAVLSGPVTIGPNTRVLYGAVLTAECGAEVVVGAECIIMERSRIGFVRIVLTSATSMS